MSSYADFIINAELANLDDGTLVKTINNNNFVVTQQAVITADNDGSFDMGVTNNFKCTPTANITLDFTNLQSGRGGVILFDNTTGITVSKAAKVIADANCLSTISTAGKYLLSYITDGTEVYMAYSKALV